MARFVREIMSSELFHVDPYVDRHAALEALLRRGITAVPVLDDDRRPIGVSTLRDIVDEARANKVSMPARTVAMNASVEDAGRTMVEAGTHHLVVVGSDGRAVGMLSSLDLVRALLGNPPAHPIALPHRDAELGVVWIDPLPFDAEHVACAATEPGVLVLSAGGLGRTESDLWVESSETLRSRLGELLEQPQKDAALAHVLEHRSLRFRCAVVSEPRHRNDVVRRMRARIDGAPLPRDVPPIRADELPG
jgi:CBS domain-containing protein